MNADYESHYYVAIIGAGPAGLFAARQLADRNVQAILLNRDIKPGGLAEYGIYPTKVRMKEGLRNQFHQILALDEIAYYGNVIVGQQADVSLEDLRAMGFQALLVTVGAQSTKRLGIPGEDLTGVYHAKDIVYHYNLLPPFSEGTYQIGKRVAVIGAGNVMMDITHWLIEDKGVDEVIAVARRGPAEVKFDKKELENVVGYLDLPALDMELERVSPAMLAIGQDPADFRQMIQHVAAKGVPVSRPPCFRLRFLSSPIQMTGATDGRVECLEVEENSLVQGEDGEVRARGSGVYQSLDVDTVIFAIGDVVDSRIGLPVQHGEFIKNPQPRFPVDGITYEAFDPLTGRAIEDTFLAGWARRASTGLVGVARKDAINAAQAVLQYLQTLQPTAEPVAQRLQDYLRQLHHPVVDKPALAQLEALERDHAREIQQETFKYGSNQVMLELLGLISPEKEP